LAFDHPVVDVGAEVLEVGRRAMRVQRVFVAVTLEQEEARGILAIPIDVGAGAAPSPSRLARACAETRRSKRSAYALRTVMRAV
jgi:hypothetical protein